MRKVYNFSAGPGMLPEEVMRLAQEEMLDWHDTGMSIMELGHRGPDFQQVADSAEANLRELMQIPDDYEVLFLAGGASTHFAMVPLNLLKEGERANYVDTGIWSKKAIEEAGRYASIEIAAKTVKKDGLYCIPSQDEWTIDSKAAYLHYTPNETIEGIEFNFVPQVGDMPLIADMSSMILSREVDVKKFGLIYAGAQKNMGPAGINIAIIRKSLLKDPHFLIPSLCNYKVQAENKSFFNTPPTYNWYLVGLVLEWVKQKGGVAYFDALNKRKSDKLHSFIDSYKDFYINKVHSSCRSRMNVVFQFQQPQHEKDFLALAHQEGLENLRGHRLVGGIRASIYNAMPESGVDKLIEFMREFARRYG